tara:strand:+ start:54 stop:386 length:333 start_codon:yes stop_codon:yes gene_type:complete
MKITNNQLKQIIKEELENVLHESLRGIYASYDDGGGTMYAYLGETMDRKFYPLMGHGFSFKVPVPDGEYFKGSFMGLTVYATEENIQKFQRVKNWDMSRSYTPEEFEIGG